VSRAGTARTGRLCSTFWELFRVDLRNDVCSLNFRAAAGLTGNRSKYFALRGTGTGRLGKQNKRISIEFY